LRHDTSVVAWRRLAREPVTLGGTDVPAGAKVLLMLASANHDSHRFPDPSAPNISFRGPQTLRLVLGEPA
jgi:cytochrome P450